MKKLVVVMMLMLFSLAAAKSEIGFKGVGGQIAFVMPEDPIDNTIGFGGNVYLGTLMPQLKLYAFVDYWGKSYGESSLIDVKFSMISIMAAARYGFSTSGNIKPYAGGGLGFNIGTSSVDYKGETYGYAVDKSESNTDLGVLLLGGASMTLSPNLEGFAEIRYNITDVEALGIYVGVTYMLK